VWAIAKLDEAVDELLYRPAIVKAFAWLPRWWLCDLARLSIVLDDRWGTGYWTENSIWPGGPCDACGRRASIHVYGGVQNDEAPSKDYLETHPVRVCGWCQLRGPMVDERDVQRELAVARQHSVSWRWRWRVRS
jgi:hypothetical protein